MKISLFIIINAHGLTSEQCDAIGLRLLYAELRGITNRMKYQDEIRIAGIVSLRTPHLSCLVTSNYRPV